MKAMLTALTLTLAMALSQAAEAKTKILLTDAKATKTEKTRPPLDESVTGGIAPSAMTPSEIPQSQPYPPALDLHF